MTTTSSTSTSEGEQEAPYMRNAKFYDLMRQTYGSLITTTAKKEKEEGTS